MAARPKKKLHKGNPRGKTKRTARRRTGPSRPATKTLKREQEFSRAFIDALDGIVWERNARTFQFTFVSKQAERILGYPAGRWIKEPAFWKDHIHPEDRDRALDICRKATKGKKKTQFEYRMVAADGRPVWLADLVTVVVKNGRPVKLQGLMTDITERKQAEREIRRNLERVRALHEINLAVTSTLDLRDILHRLLEKTDILLPYSAATVRLYNSTTGELEPVACRNLDEEEWKAEVRKGVLGLSRAVFENRTPLTVNNLRTDPRVRDPSVFVKQGLTSYLAVPMIVRGKILGVLGFYTKDVHDFSKEEREFLSTLAGQAAIAIHHSQLYEQTKKQAIELERANKGKTEFLGIISHELRTPLNVIIGFTEMIKDRVLGDLTRKQEEAIAKVTGRSRDLLHMINGILQATSIEAEAITLEGREVSLSYLLNELRSAWDAPRDKELELIWDFPSNLPVIKMDSEKLTHILQNLVNNAIKFTDRGSVAVSARFLPETNLVEFKVADTGVGIPEEALPFIFDMFRQVDSSQTRVHDGVGLGLYIVKKFTDMLGGTVQVQSEPGKGTTFTVTIPREI